MFNICCIPCIGCENVFSCITRTNYLHHQNKHLFISITRSNLSPITFTFRQIPGQNLLSTYLLANTWTDYTVHSPARKHLDRLYCPLTCSQHLNRFYSHFTHSQTPQQILLSTHLLANTWTDSTVQPAHKHLSRFYCPLTCSQTPGQILLSNLLTNTSTDSTVHSPAHKHLDRFYCPTCSQTPQQILLSTHLLTNT